MPLTQGQLDQVRRSALEDAGRRLPRRAMRGGDGELIRSIPFEAYHNAVNIHGESPRDEGYWRDMERRYPEIVVQQQRKTMISLAQASRALGASRIRTRLGVGTRYYYS